MSSKCSTWYDLEPFEQNNHKPQTTNHKPQTTNHKPQTTNHKPLYSTTTIAKKYLHYLLTSSNSKGHGMHSPFVFDFIKKVLNDKTVYADYKKIEEIRKQLLQNKNTIEVEDFGAGSGVIKTNTRRMDKIAASSLKPKKYAQLLYRIIKYSQPQQIIEIGTSFGVTTSYLASAHSTGNVITHEGAATIAAIANENFIALNLNKIKLKQGNFDTTLMGTIAELNCIDFAFIDGNHRKKPTSDYFELLLTKSNENSIFVFDDIHWSEDMERVWEEIKSHPTVTLSIDLFFIGIVFFKKDFKVKQHFNIRF
jgi:predicted O-methyltransferase YrrM